MRNRKSGEKSKNIILSLLVCFLSIFCLLSCGLEAFYYLDFLPDGEYRDLNYASIQLTPRSDDGYTAPSDYFNNFIVFYRIYISSELITGRIDTAEQRSLINATLNSDYNSLNSLTDKTSTTVNTSNLETTFFNRRYFMLNLEEADINMVLSNSSRNNTLEFSFSTIPGERPTLILNGTAYTMQRANMGPGLNFTPRPDRYFLNHADLINTANVTNEINADTATNTRQDLRYTYVSMYIAASGTSHEMPPRTIYSQPTFVGIFILANAN